MGACLIAAGQRADDAGTGCSPIQSLRSVEYAYPSDGGRAPSIYPHPGMIQADSGNLAGLAAETVASMWATNDARCVCAITPNALNLGARRV